MSFELTILVCAALLQIVQIVIYSIAGNMQVGPCVAMGKRDRPVELTGTAGRAQRAMNNHFEGLILFSIACLVVTVGDQSTSVTSACATIYLLARIFYVPAYVFGLTPWRSLIWFTGIVATGVMLIAALI